MRKYIISIFIILFFATNASAINYYLNENQSAALSGVGSSSGTVSANNFTSTAATGTKPLVVSSSTMNNNFNADMVDGLQLSEIARLDGASFTGEVKCSSAVSLSSTLNLGNGVTQKIDASGNAFFAKLSTTDTAEVAGFKASANVQLTGLAAAGSGTDLVIDSEYNVIPKTSSKKYKDNILNLELNMDKFMDFRPVRFTWNENSSCKGFHDIGFIAEEVFEIYPEMVPLKEGKPNAVNYDKMVVILTKVVQNQEKRIKLLEEKLSKKK